MYPAAPKRRSSGVIELEASRSRWAVATGRHGTDAQKSTLSRFSRPLLFCLFWAWVSPGLVHAQVTQPGIVTSRSRSGQFVIQSEISAASPLLANLDRNTNFIRLDPMLLPVSCERIKQILWRELGSAENWSCKIFLKVYPVTTAEDPITISSEQFRDGWQYAVILPNVIERSRFVGAVVQVLLLELANRSAREHSAELPTWLIEGFSEKLMTSSQLEIILPPPQDNSAGIKLTSILVNARKENPLGRAHERLCIIQPLTFQQLSWPSPNQLTGEAGEVYRDCAQLFVDELLRLEDGPACLRAMLADLPRFYNWQFAFLHAFHSHFLRPLDVEKWWALRVLHFTGRELTQTWPADESWEKLDGIIVSAVEVRVGTNELPLTVQVPLQTMIREWDLGRQSHALRTKLAELAAVRLRLSQELVPLADEYSRTIETYLQTREHIGFVFPFRKNTAFRRSAEAAIQQLDALDSRLVASRPAKKTVPPSPRL
jgi:hypothetical protein